MRIFFFLFLIFLFVQTSFTQSTNTAQGSQTPPAPQSKLSKKQAPQNADIESIKKDFVFVKGSTFSMGSYSGETDEQPTHPVTLSDFYIGKYEVRVGEFSLFIEATQYKTLAEQNGWSWLYQAGTWKKAKGINWRHDGQGNPHSKASYDHPVVHVTWEDAQAYCQWLSLVSGQNYRLPTEAEWEYAARGGNKNSLFNFAGGNFLKKVAWFGDPAGNTHPVGQKDPNELGIYDMNGNVWEWCSDWYGIDYYSASPAQNPKGPLKGDGKVLRGGSWSTHAKYCRPSLRGLIAPNNRHRDLGFRVVKVP